jgi:hypothetical protein
MASHVLSVLKSRETLTFQAFADAVLETIGDEPMEGNNERTLRRRVYDVLNVFIAARIIERNGKNIAWTHTQLQGASAASSYDAQLEHMRLRQVELPDKIRILVG